MLVVRSKLMFVETEVTDIPPALILKEKGISLPLHIFRPGAEEQTGAVQPAGMPKQQQETLNQQT